MQLDFISNVNEYGDNIVRLYDFNMAQAEKFRQVLQRSIIENKQPLDLTTVEFIEARNCSLTFRISNEDIGITTIDNNQFFCDLTKEGYEQMIALLEPFCRRETKGYQWLYDIDSQIDLLFSPGGTW